jgi:hypothetical protein
MSGCDSTLEHLIDDTIQHERKRCVRITLEAARVADLSGQFAAARILHALAQKMEQNDGWEG